MKKIVLFMIFLATVMVARAFNLSATAPTGQTLYYNTTSATTLAVVAPDNNWDGYATPAGRLQIPATVTHDGVTYSVTSIANNAFRGCDALTAVDIPGSVATVGFTAFFSCGSLAAVTMAEGVVEVGRMAFANCGALDTIVLPASLRQIGISAFRSTAYYANQDNWVDSVLYIGPFVIEVSSVVVGPVVVTEGTIGLGTGAFNYCHNMRQVVLPSTLLFVGNLAFNDCEVLDTLRTLATVPPSLSDDAFNVVPRPVVVVPCGTLAAYSAAPQWSLLTLVEDTCGGSQQSIVEAEGCPAMAVADGILHVDGVQGRAVAVHDIMGRRIFAVQSASEMLQVVLPAKGIYIVTVDGAHPHKVLAGVK